MTRFYKLYKDATEEDLNEVAYNFYYEKNKKYRLLADCEQDGTLFNYCNGQCGHCNKFGLYYMDGGQKNE